MCASVNMYMSVSVIYDFMSLCGSVDANVNCEFMYLFKCELCEFRTVFTWRARAGPGRAARLDIYRQDAGAGRR